ncbi:DNA polymerase III subunit beta [Rhizobium sp. WW_1]|jgi:DNA polymerase-3 subunit beta|uniref:DNA polymerase III subunit beta n=1 Tax=Rhizobium sp. WW_1 TaxID=1907375 RepID=UPI000648465A|nr:DNA polymerase III subunit beta [Rhizobium sp. WW_1]RKD61688.1 DNA polymerase-3 subunit beta [Rhizobium sp. WW_1]
MAKAQPLFRVHRTQLLPALDATFEAVDKKAKNPNLGNIFLLPDADMLTVRATDLDIEIETTCELLDCGDEAQAFTVKGADLRDIVRNLPESAEIEFLPGAYNGQIRIRSGKSSFSIFSLPASDFPSMATELRGSTFEIAMPDVTAAFSKVAHAVQTKDIGRPFMMGIHMHPMQDERLGFAALDGIGLAAVQIRTERLLDFPGIIIPLKTAQVIRRLFDEVKEPATIEVADNLIRIRCNGVSLLSKLIEGKFPEHYLTAAPSDYEREIFVTVASLKAAVARVCLVASETDKDGIKLTLERDTMRVELTSKEGESAIDYVPIQYEGETGFSIGLNNEALRGILNTVDTQDVIVRFGGSLPNAVFLPSVGAAELYVISPMMARGAEG